MTAQKPTLNQKSPGCESRSIMRILMPLPGRRTLPVIAPRTAAIKPNTPTIKNIGPVPQLPDELGIKSLLRGYKSLCPFCEFNPVLRLCKLGKKDLFLDKFR